MSTHAVSAAHLSPIDLLGERVEGTFTAEEALEKGHLAGWNIRKTQAYAFVGGKKIERKGMFDLVRDTDSGPAILGKYPVSESYSAIQNEEHAAFLNTLVEESGSNFELAGSMKNGEIVFLSMKMPGHIQIGGVDPIDLSLLAVNGHGGSMSFTVAAMPVRYACSNVLNSIHGGMSGLIRIRHTSGAKKQMVAQAREALDISFKYLDAFQEEAERLINTTVTQSRFEEIIEAEFGVGEDAAKAAITRSEKKIDEIAELFAEASTQDGIRETAWAGYNALTEWADHYSPARGEDADVSRAQRAILDPAFKSRALELMLAEV
jgi:phage/plasmid-like protein (TIGR03299 family)